MTEEKLSEIISRVRRLEEAVFKPAPAKGAATTHKTDTSAGLPSLILTFRDKGFFSQPRTAAEVHEKLKTGYHCDLDRVAMGLLRLHRNRQLRKTSKLVAGKKRVAYVW